MSLILNIDTTTESAFVNIAKDAVVIAELFNNQQKDHAGFLQPAIQTLINTIGISLSELDAIAVSAGPGSYTGLRVGMASAKGLCYALNKPLLMISSLEILAHAAIAESSDVSADSLFCAMIDARRMEVFTAVYDRLLNIVLAPCAMVLDQNSYGDLTAKQPVVFSGNAVEKWKTVCGQSNVFFKTGINATVSMSELSYKKFESVDFSELAYAEPFYVKDFFTTALRS